MNSPRSDSQSLDVLIVGAGFAGMYALHRMRNLGLDILVVEAGSDVGGTWYWNRYPGARCDVPSVEYSYSFSDELQQEWDWTEVMAAQPEILKYANHVADRFDLRSGILFDTRVTSAHYDDNQNRWRIETDSGNSYEARFCVMATGCLSVPNTPAIEGAEDFAGPVYHTGRWPHEDLDFTGVSLGIIGTGSSAVQAIPVLAENAEHLTVFQRTPNYTMPAGNRPLTAEFLEKAKADYPEIRKKQRESLGGIAGYGFSFGGISGFADAAESILDTPEAERQAALEAEGFAAIHRYADVMMDPQANEQACEMYRQQVARVVEDPVIADGLMPRGYPMGCKRPVIDIGYFEAFNKGNITLVDLRKGEIQRITETGVQTEQGHFEFDALIWATGFDAMTGALLRMDIRGRGGKTLQSHWDAGPRTYLGLQMNGFPNLFTVTGPGSPSVLSNMMVSIEQHVDWICDCITYMDGHQKGSIEARSESEDRWVAHVNQVAQGTMLTAPSCNSWYLGANIPGKPRIFMPYVGGVGNYRRKCDDVAAAGYEGFDIE